MWGGLLWGGATQGGARRSFGRLRSSDMLWPLVAIHAHASAIGKTRSRPRPRGSPGLEHERDGGNWALHRDSAGDSGDGRAAVFTGVAGGCAAFTRGRSGVGRTRSGDAASRRHIRIFARGLRSGTRRAPDVFSVHLANADPGAASGSFGRDRFFAIPHLPRSSRRLPTKSRFSCAGSFSDRAALSPDRRPRPPLKIFLDRRL